MISRIDRLKGLLLATILVIGVFLSLVAPASSMGAEDSTSSRSSSRTIIKGPYLQNVTTTSITVCWETDISGSSDVDYGFTASYGNSTWGSGGVTIHEVPISGLSVNTTYHYRVGTDGGYSSDHTFKTAVAYNESFSFVAYGDTRSDNVAHQAVLSHMNSYSPEFLLNSGDLVATGSNQAQWDAFFTDLDVLSEQLPYYPALGNHDQPGTIYSNYFSLPNNERYYSFDYGAVHFTVLDTNTPYGSGSPQYNWLQSDLTAANSTAQWKIVMFHHPAYSSSSHGSTPSVQIILRPVFEKFQVDAVINGHDHDYEHALVNGIHYFVAGGGGAPLYNNGTSSWTVYSESVHHFIYITVHRDRVHFIGVRTDGTTFDEFNITKPDLIAPAAVPLVATDTGLGGSIDLNWSAYDEPGQGDVAEYNVYSSTVNFTNVGSMSPDSTFPAGNLSTLVKGLDNGTTYYYAVTALDEVSNEMKVVTPVPVTPSDTTAPKPPTGLNASGPTNTSINLTWNASSEADIGGYRIFINESRIPPGETYEPIFETGRSIQAYTVTGLVDNTTYCFVLQAIDMAIIPNNSTYSPKACLKTVAIPVDQRPLASNKHPVIHFIEDPVLVEDMSYDLAQLFTDPEGDRLNFTVTSSDLVNLLDVNFTDRTLIVFKFPQNWSGSGYANVTASDGELTAWSNISVIVDPVNDPPIMNVSKTWDLVQDQRSTLVVFRSDAETLPQYLTISTDIEDVIEGAKLGSNLWINDTNGNISLIGDNDMIGTYHIMVTVSDPDGEMVQSRVQVNIEDVNDPPSIFLLAPSDGEAFLNGTYIGFLAQGSDPDTIHGDRLTYVWTSDLTGPFGYGTDVSYKLPVGYYNITATVTDDQGLWDSVTITISVYDDGTPPIIPKPPIIVDPPSPPEPGWGLWTFAIIGIGGIIILVVISILIVLSIKNTDRQTSERVMMQQGAYGQPYYHIQQPQQIQAPPPPRPSDQGQIPRTGYQDGTAPISGSLSEKTKKRTQRTTPSKDPEDIESADEWEVVEVIEEGDD